ncbi:hypothetical protein [Usitatibacter palustris]|uniref:Uncharacterized protein n=1 Tax=Usitatibacter palustris TaxID=2732487 RepID=A0A6M4H851_9PROT|nr:hypothetical protein [Usitatibacter palustris]QJR14883.1 hypothetical protein DSM104440_01698 [Usitatibacter palustris]
MKITTLLVVSAAAILGGCAYSYNLTLMPRDSGKLYYGTADNVSGGEGSVAITIEATTYKGTWVQTRPDRTTGYVAGGYGGGWRGWGWGMGGAVTMDNPEGGAAVALLQSANGAGLRCEFRSGGYGQGGGTCRDDKGMEYDVQVRPRKAA